MSKENQEDKGLNVQDLKKMFKNNLTRVEVIDWTKSVEQGGGRAYVFWEEGVNVELDIQDEGRTLKVFISPKK